MTMQFTDITSLEILCSPEQGVETHTRILSDLAAISVAKASLFSSQYSYTCQDIAEAMNTCWLANEAGLAIFDKSCADEAKDNACVQAATQGVDASRIAVGSMPGGMIVHHKLYCSPELGLVFTGSFNLTASAEREANNALFITSVSMAIFFAAEITKNLPIVKANAASATEELIGG